MSLFQAVCCFLVAIGVVCLFWTMSHMVVELRKATETIDKLRKECDEIKDKRGHALKKLDMELITLSNKFHEYRSRFNNVESMLEKERESSRRESDRSQELIFWLEGILQWVDDIPEGLLRTNTEEEGANSN